MTGYVGCWWEDSRQDDNRCSRFSICQDNIVVGTGGKHRMCRIAFDCADLMDDRTSEWQANDTLATGNIRDQGCAGQWPETRGVLPAEHDCGP
jgi:hypothetical protein